MVKKKNYKSYGAKFCGPNNPFNIHVKSNKGSDWFAKQKDIFKRNKALSHKSNTYVDERKNCPAIPFGESNALGIDYEYSNLNKAQIQGFSSEFNSRNHEVVNESLSSMEKKIQNDLYKDDLKRIDETWRKAQFSGPKNKLNSNQHTVNKDKFDICKNELIFEKKSFTNIKNPTKDSSALEVLFDISNLNSDTLLKNATNDGFTDDLHYLATKNNLLTAQKLQEILNEEYEIFLYFKRQKSKRDFPRLQTVALLSIIGKMYSLTEFRHPIVVPGLIFIGDVLGSQFYFSYSNILTRLFITEIALNYISTSKKFIPEALQFLKTVLQLAVPEGTKSKEHPIFDLIINKKVSSDEIPSLRLDPEEKTSLESKKIAVIFTIARQVFKFASLYIDYELFRIIFEPLLNIFLKLPLHLYPAEMEADIKRLIEFLGRETLPLRYLSFPGTQLKPLKMFEPAFECNYESIEEYERRLNHKTTDCRNSEDKREILKQRKLLTNVKQKIKKEERCLLRTIRKSAKVAAAVNLEKKRELDNDRQRKMKQICRDLAVQEGEFRKMIKKK